jgi:hypothetical protein
MSAVCVAAAIVPLWIKDPTSKNKRESREKAVLSEILVFFFGKRPCDGWQQGKKNQDSLFSFSSTTNQE